MCLRAIIFLIAVLAGLNLPGQDTLCKNKDLGKVEFKKNSAKLTTSAKKKLNSLITVINSQSNCEVLATSYSADLCDKCSALSWERQNSVISYLMKHDVAAKRLRSFTRLGANEDFVTLTLTSWPLSEEPPHPRAFP